METVQFDGPLLVQWSFYLKRIYKTAIKSIKKLRSQDEESCLRSEEERDRVGAH